MMLGNAAMQVQVLNSFWSRCRGLIGKATLSSHQAVLLTPCNGVHTCFMRFPIDVYFLDANHVVIERALNLPPWRSAWCARAVCVLETRSRAPASPQWQVGEAVLILPKEMFL
jgi:uncharacterized protein